MQDSYFPLYKDRAIPDLMKDKLKMFMYADDVSVLLSKNTLLLFAFFKVFVLHKFK